MEIIKNNQCLKLDLSYDQDSGINQFEMFIEDAGLERLSEREWLKIGLPDAPHFIESDLRHDDWVFDHLKEVAWNVTESSMPALTDEEFEALFDHVANEEWQEIDLDTARRGLLSLTHQEWYAALNHDSDDLSETLEPYRYTARGHSQGDVAHLYLIGMNPEWARTVTKDFEQYAYDAPYRFSVDLIDCETGESIAEDSLGGIYDDTSDLKYLKSEMVASINALDGIDEEVKALAVQAVQELDYRDIDNNF